MLSENALESTLKSLAKALAKCPEGDGGANDKTWGRLRRLLYLCPRVSSNSLGSFKKRKEIDEELQKNGFETLETKASDDSGRKAGFEVNNRSQQAILSLCLFLRQSGGNYRQKLVPILLRYLCTIHTMQWPAFKSTFAKSLLTKSSGANKTPTSSRVPKHPAYEFTLKFTSALCKIDFDENKNNDEDKAWAAHTVELAISLLLRHALRNVKKISKEIFHHDEDDAAFRLVDVDNTESIEMMEMYLGIVWGCLKCFVNCYGLGENQMPFRYKDIQKSMQKNIIELEEGLKPNALLWSHELHSLVFFAQGTLLLQALPKNHADLAHRRNWICKEDRLDTFFKQAKSNLRGSKQFLTVSMQEQYLNLAAIAALYLPKYMDDLLSWTKDLLRKHFNKVLKERNAKKPNTKMLERRRILIEGCCVVIEKLVKTDVKLVRSASAGYQDLLIDDKKSLMVNRKRHSSSSKKDFYNSLMEIRDGVLKSFSTVLHYELEVNEVLRETEAFSVIEDVKNKLNNQDEIEIVQGYLTVLGSLTLHLANPDITQSVVNMLSFRFHQQAEEFSVMLPFLPPILKMFPTNFLDIQKKIIQMLRINFLYTIEQDGTSSRAEEIAECFANICEMVRGPHHKSELADIGSFLLKEMFKLVDEIVQSDNFQIPTEAICSLLPAIANVCDGLYNVELGKSIEHVSPLTYKRDSDSRKKRLSHQNSTHFELSEIGIQMQSLNREALVSLFRRFWSTIVFTGIHKIESANPSKSEPAHYLRTIARFTPVLGGEAPSRLFAHLDEKRYDDYLKDLQKSLQRVLTTADLTTLANDNPSFLVYLHVIWTMEDFRVRMTHRAYPAFHYLADQAFRNQEENISLILNNIFENFLEATRSLKAKSERAIILERHTEFLISMLCNRFASMRSAASVWLDKLSETFPNLMWNSKALQSLHTLIIKLENLERSNRTAMYNKAKNIKTQMCFGSHFQIDLPEERVVQAEILKSLRNLLGKWFNNSLENAQEEYIANMGHCCVFSEHASLGNHMSENVDEDELMKSARRRLVNTVSLYENYVGRVDGMFDVNDGDRNFVSKKARWVVEGLSYHLDKFLTDFENRDVIAKEIIKRLYIGAALVMWYENELNKRKEHRLAFLGIDSQHHQQLLHALTFVPARVFDAEIMQAAVKIWRWISACSLQIGEDLFIEMQIAWQWTIHNRKGIFGKNQDSQPHSIWLRFLHTCFPSVIYRSESMLLSIYRIVAMSCFDSSLLTKSSNAFGAYMSLLKLGVTVIKMTQKRPTLVSEVADTCLTWKVYQCVYHWFQQKPAYHDCKDWEETITEAETLGFLCAYFANESVESKQSKPETLKKMATPSMVRRTTSSSPKSKTLVTRSTFINLGDRDPSEWGASTKEIPTPPIERINTPFLSSSTLGLEVQGIEAPSSYKSISSADEAYANMPRLMKRNSSWTTFAGFEDSLSEIFYDERLDYDHLHISDRDKRLALVLLRDEFERFSAWHNPTGAPEKRFKGDDRVCGRNSMMKDKLEWNQILTVASHKSHLLAYYFYHRFQWHQLAIGRSEFMKEWLETLISANNASFLYECSDPVLLFADPGSAARSMKDLSNDLDGLIWSKPASLCDCLFLLNNEDCMNHLVINHYTLRSLNYHCCQDMDRVIFYLPQLLQALNNDRLGLLQDFLTNVALQDMKMCHQLLWLCKCESILGESLHESEGTDEAPLCKIATQLDESIVSQLDDAQKEFYLREFQFFDAINSCSEEVNAKKSKEEKAKEVRENLHAIMQEWDINSGGLYLPSSPGSEVFEIFPDDIIPLMSAAKVPILIPFTVKQTGGQVFDDYNRHPNRKSTTFIESHRKIKQNCIFKTKDDCRQDALALQVIELCKDIFEAANLELKLIPYKVIPTRSGKNKVVGGIIECVNNAKSIHEIGDETRISLSKYFKKVFGGGSEETFEFKEAQRNFLMTQAGYAVACYLLQVKDRHNGNLMIDNKGHLIHIDFGFIFDISPGGNLKFEKADFKMTTEMVQLLGGANSPLSLWFKELVIRGFLAVRERKDEFNNLAALMSHSSLPCFLPQTLENLSKRFTPAMHSMEASQHMNKIIMAAMGSFTTEAYDRAQNFLQGTYHHTARSELPQNTDV